MNVNYELWDTETGNLVEALPSEADALLAARELVAMNADVSRCPDAVVDRRTR
ncbi:MAG: hypothetical protein U0821_05905 [Chloroflexota bacterium]